MPKECEKKMPKSLHRKDAGNVRTDPEEKQLLDHHYIASHACLGKSEGQVVRQKSPVRLNVGWKHVIGVKKPHVTHLFSAIYGGCNLIYHW